MSPRSAVWSLLAVALVLTTAAGSTAAPSRFAVVEPTPVTSIGDDYFPWDGNGGIDVLHYDVRDRYRFGTGRLDGTTVVTLRAREDLERFALDLLLPVDRVLLDGDRVAHRKPNRHELVVTPDTTVAAGDVVRVRVEYAGRPDDVGWQGERNWRASRREVVTVNQPHMAAWWFPANDHPRDKARFDIRITTGADKKVVSNGRLLGRTVRGDLATTHWRMADPMATYLAFFAAGDFAVERGRTGGIPWYNAVSRGIGGWRQELDALRPSARITAWLQRELGEYPFANTGGLVTDLGLGFALENQTRPVYPQGTVYRDLLVHELAHQWFGNSVSVHRWRDIWLNEGFATYLELRYDEAHGGRSTDRWLRVLHRSYGAGDPFWEVVVADPGPRRLFAGAVYERGAMALAALRNRVGDADFRAVVRRWAAQRRDRTGTVEGFEALAERVSGVELSRFFDVWLRTPEKPARTAANGF